MSTQTTTRPLTRFWLVLERLPGPAAVAAEWRKRVGGDFELIEPLLAPDHELAAAFPRLDRPGDPYSVVSHGPDDHVGVGEGDERIKLTRADVVVHRLSPIAFTRAIAGAFGIVPDGAAVEGLAGTYSVGQYRAAPGFSFPAYVTMQLEWREHLWAVDGLLVRDAKPFLLFAPTTRHHRGIVQERLEARDAAFLPLADAIRLGDGGVWEATDAARALLGEFRSRVLPAGEAPRFPTPPGARWSDVRIGFLDGHRVTVKVVAVKRTLNYTQMGFVDGRSADPDVQWELLREFADGHGTLTWASPGADRKNQKRKELLAQGLQAFFQIEGDPITPTANGKGWRTAFAVESR